MSDDNGLHDIMEKAFPMERDYVTRRELSMAIENIAARQHTSEEMLSLKIEKSEIASRNWVLTGCLAILVTFSGGYISLVVKLDRITESLPPLQRTMDDRRVWMLRQDQRDDQQDQVLRTLDPAYKPLPYEASPR